MIFRKIAGLLITNVLLIILAGKPYSHFLCSCKSLFTRLRVEARFVMSVFWLYTSHRSPENRTLDAYFDPFQTFYLIRSSLCPIRGTWFITIFGLTSKIVTHSSVFFYYFPFYNKAKIICHAIFSNFHMNIFQ